MWNNEPHSLGYERTGGDMSVACAFQRWAEYRFLYIYIDEQCLANCIKNKKIEMVSSTYMVEECLEKRPAFNLEYVMISSVK